MNTEIPPARDVLAKWRHWMSPDPWTISESAVKDTAGTMVVDYGDVQNLVAQRAAQQNLRLIVGTAGNPELLDAIDELLALAIEYGDLAPGKGSRFIDRAVRIAAAITTADQRMSA